MIKKQNWCHLLWKKSDKELKNSKQSKEEAHFFVACASTGTHARFCATCSCVRLQKKDVLFLDFIEPRLCGRKNETIASRWFEEVLRFVRHHCCYNYTYGNNSGNKVILSGVIMGGLV